MEHRIIKYPHAQFQSDDNLNKIVDYLNTDHFQSIPYKTKEEVALLKSSGAVCASILDEISPYVQPGVTLRFLNDKLKHLITQKYESEIDRLETNVTSSAGDRIAACLGLNNIIVNAEPDDTTLTEGDIFGIDISVRKNGWCGDTRKSWLIGTDPDPQTLSLFTTSQQAMWMAIGMIKDGLSLDVLGKTIENFARSRGCEMLKFPIFSGHSLGKVHMDGWLIPLYDSPRNKGRILKSGMVITIETFMTNGSGEAGLLDNSLGSGVTKDGAYACYWEHAVLVADTGCEILDLRSNERSDWSNVS